MPEFDFLVLTSTAEFETLRSCWPARGAPKWGPLESFDWFSSGARHLVPPGALRIVVVRRGGEVVAVAPLQTRRLRGQTWLEVAGADRTCEPTRLVAADDVSMRALLERVLALELPVIVQRIDANDAMLSVLPVLERQRLMKYRCMARPGSYFLNPDQPGSATASRRKRIRYQWRRLQSAGARLVALVPSEFEVADIMQRFGAVEAAGWKGRQGTSLADQSDLQRFFYDLAESLAARGQLRVWAIECEGRWLAAQICARCDGRLWVLKIGLDERWERYSPGILLTDVIVNYARDEGIGLELLGVAEDWQKAWRPTSHALCAVVMYPSTYAGGLARLLDILASIGKRLLRSQTVS